MPYQAIVGYHFHKFFWIPGFAKRDPINSVSVCLYVRPSLIRFHRIGSLVYSDFLNEVKDSQMMKSNRAGF